MNLLQYQQTWELSLTHQAELLREAQQAHLANLACPKQPRSWAFVLRWWRRRPRLELPPRVTPELG